MAGASASAGWRLPKQKAVEAAAEDDKGKRQKTNGKDKKEKRQAEEEEEVMDDLDPMNLVDIITLLTKGQLQLHQQFREVVAGSWVTYESKETPFVKDSVAAGKGYSETVKEKGKGHGLGSPHVHTLLAGLEADVAEELEEGIKEMMKQLVLGLVGKGKKFISEHFYHFRVKQMYQQAADGEARYKIEIGLNLFGDFDMEL